jgi:outer membrane autotransporter protein
MKNFRLMALVAAAALIPLAPAASALAEGFYVTPKVGWSSFKAKIDYDMGGGSDSKTKSVTPFGLAFGYDFKPAAGIPVRTEVEYAYRGRKEMINYADGADSIKADVGTQSLFVNAYFDIHNSSPVTPYVGLGVGYAVVSTDLEGNIDIEGKSYKFRQSETEVGFAWNMGAGAAWAINDSLSLDLGYRYADFGTTEEKYLGYDIGDLKTTAHEVLLGLRFSF